MAIFGRRSARRRLRRATHESLTIPVFSSPIDCTPWVLGGIWPAELSIIRAETATFVEHLKAELQRIANNANGELKTIRRDQRSDPDRRAEELRVIDAARARALRRVESAIRHLHAVRDERPAGQHRRHAAEKSGGLDLDKTQVIPVVTAEEPAVDVR